MSEQVISILGEYTGEEPEVRSCMVCSQDFPKALYRKHVLDHHGCNVEVVKPYRADKPTYETWAVAKGG